MAMAVTNWSPEMTNEIGRLWLVVPDQRPASADEGDVGDDPHPTDTTAASPAHTHDAQGPRLRRADISSSSISCPIIGPTRALSRGAYPSAAPTAPARCWAALSAASPATVWQRAPSRPAALA